MKKKRVNITLEPLVFENFVKLASKKGIQASTWVNAKMKEFIEEGEMISMKPPYFIDTNREYQYFDDNNNQKWRRKFCTDGTSEHGQWEKLRAIATIGGDDY